MSAPRRYRQCPKCGAVRAASAFETTGRNRPGYGARQRGRRCPACGHTGATWIFEIVPDKGSPAVHGVRVLDTKPEPPEPPAPDPRYWQDDVPKRRADPSRWTEGGSHERCKVSASPTFEYRGAGQASPSGTCESADYDGRGGETHHA